VSGATSKTAWRPLRDLGKARMTEARLQAHYAVQWLARAARAYIPPQPDDGHTSLHWDDALDGLTTQPFTDGARLSLKIADLRLVLHDGAGAVQSMALAGRTDRDVRAWLRDRLAERGLDANALDAPTPYQMPAHTIADNAPYDAAGSADALAMLSAWYANANALLQPLQQRLTARKLAPSPVACWPHHFDIAILVTLPKPNPEQTGYVGAGLSPGDGYYDEPYFYVSVYPKPEATLPPPPELAHWHTHEFTALVAPAHKIAAAKDQQRETEDYLNNSVDHALELLR
jgi:Family of unknown function (DUF5996)